MANIRKTQYGYRADWRDPAGHRYRKTFELKKDAEEFLANTVVAVHGGTYVSPREIPTFRQAADLWLDGKRRQGCRVTTLAFWKINLDRHILPTLGDLRLDQIDMGMIERLRDRCQDGDDQHRKLQPQTVNKVLTIIRGVFAFAVKRKLATTNPAFHAENLRVANTEVQDGDDAPRRSVRMVQPDDVLSYYSRESSRDAKIPHAARPVRPE